MDPYIIDQGVDDWARFLHNPAGNRAGDGIGNGREGNGMGRGNQQGGAVVPQYQYLSLTNWPGQQQDPTRDLLPFWITDCGIPQGAVLPNNQYPDRPPYPPTTVPGLLRSDLYLQYYGMNMDEREENMNREYPEHLQDINYPSVVLFPNPIGDSPNFFFRNPPAYFIDYLRVIGVNFNTWHDRVLCAIISQSNTRAYSPPLYHYIWISQNVLQDLDLFDDIDDIIRKFAIEQGITEEEERTLNDVEENNVEKGKIIARYTNRLITRFCECSCPAFIKNRQCKHLGTLVTDNESMLQYFFGREDGAASGRFLDGTMRIRAGFFLTQDKRIQVQDLDRQEILDPGIFENFEPNLGTINMNQGNDQGNVQMNQRQEDVFVHPYDQIE